MATITDIKRGILGLAPAPFQEFCDTLISKNGYGIIHGYGMKAGTGKTTIGNPDTYFKKENGKYLLVAYTTQDKSIYSKLKEDIDKCLDITKTGLDVTEIEEIFCCHTSSNLSAGDDKKLHDYCKSYSVSLTIWGLDEIANQVHNKYRSMAKDFLGLSIDTNQILSVEDFIKQSDANGMSAPLSTTFQYRKKEKEEIIKAFEIDSAIIITGRAGVGKTRLVLEVVQTFIKNKGYKLLCVKNNNLGLYDDLVSATEKPGNYLFFVDDANELSQLDQILAYTTKKEYGFNVKIIATVRDYAKSKLILSVKDYTFPRIIEILPFSDEEIKGFLNDNLGIKNEDYVKQIIKIAEGNPRIAYMAGKLALEQQKLSAIRDVSQLYDAYYGKYINSTLGEDRDLCFTAGVISVINAVILDNLCHLHELIDNYGISSDDFKNKIRQLSSLEVVEIQLDQVAILTDQCLANYMLYYVFFKKKIIPFSNVIETGYKYFHNGVIKAINTILNLFESKETRDYFKQEILVAWDNLKRENHPSFEDFVKDFHVFRPEEAFIIAQNMIDKIKYEEFDVIDIDFSKNIFYQYESILAFLTGYEYSEHMDYVMELLLNYTSKSSKAMVSGFKWLENYYGIGVSDYKYKYYTQIEISKYLLDALSKDNNLVNAISLQWAKYSLGFSFQSTEMGRGNKFVFSSWDLKDSEGLFEYRRMCWKILIKISSKHEWVDKVLLIIDNYSNNLYGEPDISIVANEVACVEELLYKINCNQINFFNSVNRIITYGKRMGVTYDKKWDEIFSNKAWELYNILKFNYNESGLDFKEYARIRKSKIIVYANNIKTSDIEYLVKNVNYILGDLVIKRDSYWINEGLELIIKQFDEKLINEFLNQFITWGENISINPFSVMNIFEEKTEYSTLLKFLKGSSFPQKNEWIFSFFETLPVENVDGEMLSEMLNFLEDESDKNVTKSPYRSLRVLDKFIELKPNIYPIASTIIYKKRYYSNFIVNIYFELLFHDQRYSPKELLVLFESNIDLLQDIYFYILKQHTHVDYHGKFLIEFLELDDTCLKKYTEVFWEYSKNNNLFHDDRINALWKSDSYIKYFDYIFYNFPKDEFSRWRIVYTFKNILTHNVNEDITKQNQREWLRHIIKQNATNDWNDVIFELVCELDDYTKRFSIQAFLENNSDFEAFDKLHLTPNHWSGGESFIPEYQKQIDYLESLYPIVAGMKYIKHKAKIKSKVEQLKQMIKHEEVDAIYRNLYM